MPSALREGESESSMNNDNGYRKTKTIMDDNVSDPNDFKNILINDSNHKKRLHIPKTTTIDNLTVWHY